MKGFSRLVALLFATALLSGVQAAGSADQKFIKTAAESGLAEVELARLAREKATLPEVRQYAEHLAQDHEQANERLQSIATQKGVALPAEPDAKHKREKERLSKMNGPDFDRAYIDAMVKDHKQVLRQFEKEAKEGEDADLKRFAADTVPKLRQHLEQAQQLQNTVKAGKKAAS